MRGVACPTCDGTATRQLWLGTELPSVNGTKITNLNLWRCLECRTIFVFPLLTEAESQRYYPKDYYQVRHPIFDLILKLVLMSHPLHRPSSWLNKRLLKVHHGMNILEVGCGAGNNLASYQMMGGSCVGIEPNPRLASLTRKRLGVTVYSSLTELLNRNHVRFDLVILNHSLEHIANPRAALTSLRPLLSHEGRLYVEVPTLDALEFSIFKKYWDDLQFPVHLTMCTDIGWSLLLSKAGFFPISIVHRTLWESVMRSVHASTRASSLRHTSLLVPWLAIAALVQAMLAFGRITLGRGAAVVIVARPA